MAVKLQLRRGTAAQWSAANPLLAEGELAVELDTGKFKVGNGIKYWNQLDYTPNITENDLKYSLVNILSSSTGAVSWTYNTVTNQVSSSVSLSSLSDLDILTNPDAGSLLIFDEKINKWVATTEMNEQKLDGGLY
jgi:hypothetical protein